MRAPRHMRPGRQGMLSVFSFTDAAKGAAAQAAMLGQIQAL
jgi:hypothetical protein